LLLATLSSVLFSSTPLPAAAAGLALSFDARSKIRSVLPDYSPAEHAKAETVRAAAAAIASDPDVVVLPPMTVQASTLRWMEEDSFYRRGAFDKELVKRELSTFDRCFLNRFTLPLFGISKEARACQAYLERKNREIHRRVSDLARAVQATDPAEAAALRACAVQWQ
jgi:hypothetical protein